MKKLKIGFCVAILMVSIALTAFEKPFTNNISTMKDLIGRWDLTLDDNGKPAPSWLEVKLSGSSTLVGYYVAIVGSARPIAKIDFADSKFFFTIPPQWEGGDKNFVVEGKIEKDQLNGTVTDSEGKIYHFTGVRAPLLKRSGTPVWGSPIKLFNGKNLSGWDAVGGENNWVVKNGILTNAKPGANLITTKKFKDFKLHIEFKYPKGGNSGVYLRGRHEVQIEDSPKDAHPSNILYSGVYGFLTPSEINSKGPDVWQHYDITLIGRMVTIVANGKTVISNQEIPGITGGALDSNEGEPGPIYLQGDHQPVEFRNIILTPAK
ncbi:MAG: DUF1080 domain-containing protein [Niabella sp.]